MKKKKELIEFRRYDLSGSEPVLIMDVDTWKKCYPEGSRILHFHNLMEIGVCHEGNGILAVDDMEYPFAADMISVIPANMTHGTFGDTDDFGHWHYLFFDVDNIINELWKDDIVFRNDFLHRVNKSGLFFRVEDHPLIAETVDMIIREYDDKNEFYRDSIRGLLRSLILQIYRLNTDLIKGKEDLSRSGQIIKSAVVYIGNHYSEHLTIKLVADECGLSEPHFRRVFKRIMNVSTLEYINYVRIQKACELLRTTNKPMTAVADLVGYESVSAFNRNFRKIVGMSPYQWKKDPGNYMSKLLEFKISSLKGW